MLADELMRFRVLWDVPKLMPVGPTVPRHRLGLLERAELAQVASRAAWDDIVTPLAAIGVELTREEQLRVFGRTESDRSS